MVSKHILHLNLVPGAVPVGSHGPYVIAVESVLPRVDPAELITQAAGENEPGCSMLEYGVRSRSGRAQEECNSNCCN